MTKAKVIIEVRGGVVVSVQSNNPSIEVTTIDYDGEAVGHGVADVDQFSPDPIDPKTISNIEKVMGVEFDDEHVVIDEERSYGPRSSRMVR